MYFKDKRKILKAVNFVNIKNLIKIKLYYIHNLIIIKIVHS